MLSQTSLFTFHYSLFTLCILNVLLVIFAVGCADDRGDPSEPPIASFETADQISGIQLTSTSIDVDTWDLSYRWTCDDKSIDIENKSGIRAFFKIPAGSPEKKVTVTLAVYDGFSKRDISQIVDVPAYSVQRAGGLGSELQEGVTDKTSYPWYIDQSSSGVFSSVNCGPASVTMALKWFNKSFSSTAQDARNVYHSEGGWWFTNDIINYLNNNGATNYTIALDEIDRLKGEIDAGNIVILCLDMYYISKELRPEHHTNKFYAADNAGWGHFIVVKGYKKVDGIVYYEAYDPYSFGATYTDGKLKGIDRYYKGTELNASTDVWWDYAIVVTKSSLPTGGRQVNVGDILHKPGR